MPVSAASRQRVAPPSLARLAVALLVALVSQVANAEPATVLFGDGHSGALVVTAAATVINQHAALAQPEGRAT